MDKFQIRGPALTVPTDPVTSQVRRSNLVVDQGYPGHSVYLWPGPCPLSLSHKGFRRRLGRGPRAPVPIVLYVTVAGVTVRDRVYVGPRRTGSRCASHLASCESALWCLGVPTHSPQPLPLGVKQKRKKGKIFKVVDEILELIRFVQRSW